MGVYLTDGSFEGLLCAVYASYRGPAPAAIVDRSMYQASLLDVCVEVSADPDIARRVLEGIDNVSDGQAGRLCLMIFLSEFADAPLLCVRLAHYLMRVRQPDYLKSYAASVVMRAAQIRKMMDREILRLHPFVRFQQGHHGFWYALVDHCFDVLTLLDYHFVRR